MKNHQFRSKSTLISTTFLQRFCTRNFQKSVFLFYFSWSRQSDTRVVENWILSAPYFFSSLCFSALASFEKKEYYLLSDLHTFYNPHYFKRSITQSDQFHNATDSTKRSVPPSDRFHEAIDSNYTKRSIPITRSDRFQLHEAINYTKRSITPSDRLLIKWCFHTIVHKMVRESKLLLLLWMLWVNCYRKMLFIDTQRYKVVRWNGPPLI